MCTQVLPLWHFGCKTILDPWHQVMQARLLAGISVMSDALLKLTCLCVCHSVLVIYYGMLWYTAVYCGILWYTVVYCAILWYTVLYCGILWYTVVYCSILWYNLLRYAVLYCGILSGFIDLIQAHSAVRALFRYP